MKELSFCISVKDRFGQISETLRKNLDDNLLHREIIEFVIIDFSSTNHLQSWILENFVYELNIGYLNYFYSEELKYWHSSVAKNTAHLYSSGKICVNLDCDNFTGKNGGKFVLDFYKRNGKSIVLHQFSGRNGDGSYGRISILREYFDELGGYNEVFEPAGFQDNDLILRAMEYNLGYVNISDREFCVAIENSKGECIKLCNSKMSWHEMNNLNRLISKNNIRQGILTANCKNYGIRSQVFKFFKGKFIGAEY